MVRDAGKSQKPEPAAGDPALPGTGGASEGPTDTTISPAPQPHSPSESPPWAVSIFYRTSVVTPRLNEHFSLFEERPAAQDDPYSDGGGWAATVAIGLFMTVVSVACAILFDWRLLFLPVASFSVLVSATALGLIDRGRRLLFRTAWAPELVPMLRRLDVSGARFTLAARGLSAALRVQSLVLPIDTQDSPGPVVRTTIFARYFFLAPTQSWTIACEASCAAPGGAFVSSGGRIEGLAAHLPVAERNDLIEKLHHLAPHGLAYLGMTDGRIRIEVHGPSFSRALIEALAKCTMDGVRMFAAAQPQVSTYRQLSQRGDEQVNSLARRAFSTEQEGESLYWQSRANLRAWRREDKAWEISVRSAAQHRE